MKIAIVQEHVDIRRGGAETSTLEMAGQLAALGLDVTVVCVGSDEATERRSDEELDSQGTPGGWPIASAVGDANATSSNATGREQTPRLKFHRIPITTGSRVARAVRFVAEADRYCREERFDIVHAVTPCFSCNVYQPRGGTYVEAVRRSTGRARTWLGRFLKRFGRRFNRRQRFLLLVERAMLSDPNPPFVAAVSDYVADQVRQAFPAHPAERLRVVFNGVEIDPLHDEESRTRRLAVRRELGIDHATPLVLFVAHNFKLKGLGELLHATAIRSQSESEPEAQARAHFQSEPEAQAWAHHSRDGTPHAAWTLAVVGRGNPAPFRRLARKLGILDPVRFLGPRGDLAALYAAADVLAHPTWYDPCSRVVLEALCCGLPVVTTRFNGAAEVMEAGRHGVVLDSPRDVEALAAAIDECLKPSVRAACTADAPRMRERLSMARHARELADVYKQILR